MEEGVLKMLEAIGKHLKTVSILSVILEQPVFVIFANFLQIHFKDTSRQNDMVKLIGLMT